MKPSYFFGKLRLTAENDSIVVALYLAARFVFWSVAIYLTQPVLPLDVLEHLAWGREWRLVYSSHPGLPAWINESVHALSGGNHLALSAVAPFFTTLAIWAIWRLSKQILNDNRRAIIAALSTEGVLYFNLNAVEFNHNVVQLSAIALLGVCAYKAFFAGGRWWWLGGAAALSVYAKYSSVLWLAALLLWSVCDPRARVQYRRLGPWLSIGVFLLLMIPNIVALSAIDFQPLEFALGRAKKAVFWWQHIVFPMKFLAAQLLVAALSLLLCAAAAGSPRWTLIRAGGAQVRFILVIAFVPLLLALLISAVAGYRLKSMWGFSMCMFWPLLWICLAQEKKSRIIIWRRGFVAVTALIFAANIAIFSASPYLTGRAKRAHYPARAVAQVIDAEWAKQFPSRRLQYVIGKKHAASMIAYYSDHRPAAVIDGDWQKSFYASRELFDKTGGVLAWVVDDGRGVRMENPPSFAGQFVRARRQPNFRARFLTRTSLPPMEIGWMIIPPEIPAGL